MREALQGAADLKTGFQCEQDQELFFNNFIRYSEFNKGEGLHQVTTGNTGFDFTNICATRPSMGHYRYATNMVHGFSHVYVDEHVYTVKMMGINYADMSAKEMYRITVFNNQLYYSMTQ